jgi:hypothetical protein
MRPVLSGSAHRFAIFRQPPCFSGRGAEEGRLRATSGLSHGQAGWLSLTLCGHLQPNDGSTVDLTAQSAPSAMTLNSTRCAAPA